MRTIIEVPEDVIASLDRIGEREQRSRAALIREAIQAYLRQKQASEAADAFGIWKNRQEDGLSYQERLRGEWDAE
ncbi:MAG: ribbon-helix-helix protein, CopG family [Verrucomicrobiota bacterium JB022]|nr:ribbon-helix-helix protein, CopG family [Verrucomicrobiota bacterium JB022]